MNINDAVFDTIHWPILSSAWTTPATGATKKENATKIVKEYWKKCFNTRWSTVYTWHIRTTACTWCSLGAPPFSGNGGRIYFEVILLAPMHTATDMYMYVFSNKKSRLTQEACSWSGPWFYRRPRLVWWVQGSPPTPALPSPSCTCHPCTPWTGTKQ